MQKHIAVGLMQVISASIAGGLLGDTIPHAVGIFCALYCLAPVYMERKNENRKLSRQAEHATAESHGASQDGSS